MRCFLGSMLIFTSFNVIVSSRRTMLTFHNASMNDEALSIVLNFTDAGSVIKHYGRRMVLDSDKSDEWLIDLLGGDKNIASIESDLVAVSSSDNETIYQQLSEVSVADEEELLSELYQTSWNLEEAEPNSLKIKSLRSITNGTATVAILDTGLSASIFKPAGGYNFITANGESRNPDFTDAGDCGSPIWHGTAIASVIKAIAPHTALQIYRVLDSCGTGFASDVADAVVWAAGGKINGLDDNVLKADVIAMSFSGEGRCPSYLQSAVTQALDLGVTLIAAAGNARQNSSLFFPGNCRGVLNIGASARKVRLASYSNWGNMLSLSAPGGDIDDPISILTIGSAGQLMHGTAFGTSFAVPHVSGLYSLLLGVGVRASKALDFSGYGVFLDVSESTILPANDNRTNNASLIYTETLQSALLLIVACTYCGPGYTNVGCDYFNSGSCNQCASVSPGYYFTTAGSCANTACPPNTYSSGTSSVSCASCGLNSYSSSAASSCTCNAGYVLGQDGSCFKSTSCAVQCPEGSYNNRYGQCAIDYGNCIVCLQCADGTYNRNCDPSGVNAAGQCASCSTCNAGLYLSGCADRSPGTCVTCPTCNAGQYLSGCTGRSSGTCLSCGTCNAGQYLSGCTGQSSGTCLSCDACGANQYRSGCADRSAGQCISCPACEAGKYLSGCGGLSSGSCVVCPVNTYSLSSSTACTACTTGTFSNPGSSECQAAITCAAGTIQNPSYNVISSYYSASCPLGSYVCGFNHQNLYGYFFYCCALGGLQAGYWRVSTRYFDSGVNIGAVFVSTNSEYPPSPFDTRNTKNYFKYGISQVIWNWNGATIYSNQVATVVGTTGGPVVDISCQAGQLATGFYGWYGDNIDQASVMCNNLCVSCTAGSYSSSGSTVCNACPSGTVSSMSGATACYACSTGQYSSSQSTSVCLFCSAGTYTTSSGKTACVACSTGQFGSSIGSTLCMSCSAGTYTINPGSTVCSICPSGWASGASAAMCYSCPSGQYSSSASSGSCLSCLAGTYAYFSGTTACQACPFGTGSVAGSSVCVTCSPDSACRMTGGTKACKQCNSVCAVCSAGKYNDGNGVGCTDCSAGKYSTTQQATTPSVCAACSLGFSMLPTQSGVTTCTACATLGLTVPANAKYVSDYDLPLCSWTCNDGYLLYSPQTSGTTSQFTTKGYTSAQADILLRNVNNYCCNINNVGVGQFLDQCSRSSGGVVAQCPSIPNGYFIDSGRASINRCSDWACNPWYFSNGTACIQQPICAPNYTYLRNSTTGELISSKSNAFTCVPCSPCMYGSRVLIPCNGTVDTQCILCSSSLYSNGSGCVATVPLGYFPVGVQLSRIPPFQGRPNLNYDGSRLDWDSIDFQSGFFFVNTYAPCQSIAPYLSYTGKGDALCRRLDIESKCTLLACNTQCKPWNGTAGWYWNPSIQQCIACTYDSTCAANQYSDMTVCGPDSAPVCTSCPAWLPANAVRWSNPGRFLTGSWPCDIVCKDGFIKSNYSCIYCPNLPNNSKVVSGCDWVCSLGFFQSGSICLPCIGEPVTCSVGRYRGYAANSQCASCLPCTNLPTDNSAVYVSPGRDNGPDSCGIRCVTGTYVDPQYGRDVFGNPVACIPCSSPRCVDGVSYFVDCTATSDATCVPCSTCPPGSEASIQCRGSADAVCTPCDVALPINASWTQECRQWSCNVGFYFSNSGEQPCMPCKTASQCRRSDRFDYVILPDCGACTPCNASLILPGQCFNGDGQCGVSYWCGFTTTFIIPTSSSTPYVTTTTTGLITTTAAQSTTAVQNTTYAAVLTLTVPSNMAPEDIMKLLACQQQQCSFELASVTYGNLTCTGVGCHRRLLLSANDTMVIEVIVRSPVPIQIVPVAAPVEATVTNSYIVPDQLLISDTRQLSQYIKSMEKSPPDAEIPWITLGVVGGMSLILIILLGVAFAGEPRLARQRIYIVRDNGNAQFNWNGVRIKTRLL